MGLDDVAPAIAFGASPRASINLVAAGRALAFMRGRSYVLPHDVMEVAPQYDATTNTAQVAAQVLFTELCLVALDPRFVSRKQGIPASGT